MVSLSNEYEYVTISTRVMLIVDSRKYISMSIIDFY